MLKEKITRKSDYRKFSRQELTDRLLRLEGEVRELESYLKRRMDEYYESLNRKISLVKKEEMN